MGMATMRLALAGFWLAVAAVAAFRPAGLAERLEGQNAGMIALVAMLLAGWNVSRWNAGRRRPIVHATTLGTRPLRRGEERTEEYLPEFDFTKRDDGA